MKFLTRVIALTILVTLPRVALASNTWYVNGASGSDSNHCLSAQAACKTIGHAISLAASGDSIIVAPATYTENLTVSISLNVIGSGSSTTIIDGGVSCSTGAPCDSVVTISNASAHVTLSKLTISNGKASVGAGIKNSGTLTLSNSTVTRNSANIPCQRFFVFCEIRAGFALGGGIFNSGVLIINNSTISGNHAGSYCNATPCSAFGGGI